MVMSGKTYVDGADIYEAYGVYVTSGGWNSLVAMPPLKTPDSNDWQEEDGAEVDLTAPVLDTKEVTVSFAASSSASRLFDFIAALSDGAYHKFDCAWIGRTYTLRMVSQSKMSYDPALGTFSLKLADDFPLPDYRYKAPEGGIPGSAGYVLGISEEDGDRALGEYGVRVLSGTLGNVLSTPEVKAALLRNISGEAGAEYDGDAGVTFKSKDVKLQCLMRAGTLEGLWRNWDALLYDLVRPGSRTLWVAAAGGQGFTCHYKSCSVTAFSPEGRPWLQFTLTLTFTGGLRIYMGEWLLSSEAGELVTTEDGEDCIDMRPVSPLAEYGAAGVSGLSAETYAEDSPSSDIRKVKVSELEECADLTGLWTLGTDRDNDSVKVSLEFVGEAAVAADNAANYATTAGDRASGAAGDAEAAATNANEAAQACNSAAGDVESAIQRADSAADNANSAAVNANAAATACNSAAADVEDAIQRATSAATNASSAGAYAVDCGDAASAAASNANLAADNANEAVTEAGNAAQSARDATSAANDAAIEARNSADTANQAVNAADAATTNANAAAQACYDAIEALGDIANIVPITNEEIDELLKDFRFIDSFKVTAEGEYPLSLDATNSADGADITGSVDISEIDEADIRKAFENG